ncbi:MAG: thioredoxin domain-containing protein [Nanoarchaeota archaeon]
MENKKLKGGFDMETQKNDTITIKKDTLWKYSTFILLGIVILGVVFFVLPGKSPTGNVVQQPGQQLPPTGGRVEVDIGNSPALGSEDAPVTIVEFSDAQCPFCRKWKTETYPQLKKDYIDTGLVKLVYKDFPLSFHEGAVPYAKASRCARDIGGDEAFFKMRDKIVDEQNAQEGGTVKSTVPYPGDSVVKGWAKELGYNIDSCLDSTKFESDIDADFAYGASIGIQGTPGFFVGSEDNDYQLISGAQPYSVFRQIIDAELG